MSVVVLLTAKAKEGMYQTLVDTFKAILPDTAAFEGAQLIRAAADAENEAVLVYEVWDKIESQQAYLAWRGERGDLETLGGMLREPPHFQTFEDIF